MSSNFLQRFKGKTQTLSKDGVHNILGSKNIPAQPQPQPPHQQKPQSSTKQKSTQLPHPPQLDQAASLKNKTAKQSVPVPPANKTNKTDNPFLVANPFYLDEEEREREELQKRERARVEEETRKALQAQSKLEGAKDPKEVTKTSNYSRSVEKKKDGKDGKDGKEWVRLGGLGANIGGDDWVQKKKKQQKMQQFAGQVKTINADKIKPRPDIPKPKQKQQNPRQKALEYSKNIPKPVLRKQQEEEEVEIVQKKEPEREEELTELQIYAMKHEQLKKMIHNNY